MYITFLVPEIICLVNSRYWNEKAIAAVKASERRKPVVTMDFNLTFMLKPTLKSSEAHVHVVKFLKSWLVEN